MTSIEDLESRVKTNLDDLRSRIPSINDDLEKIERMIEDSKTVKFEDVLFDLVSDLRVNSCLICLCDRLFIKKFAMTCVQLHSVSSGLIK